MGPKQAKPSHPLKPNQVKSSQAKPSQTKPSHRFKPPAPPQKQNKKNVGSIRINIFGWGLAAGAGPYVLLGGTGVQGGEGGFSIELRITGGGASVHKYWQPSSGSALGPSNLVTPCCGTCEFRAPTSEAHCRAQSPREELMADIPLVSKPTKPHVQCGGNRHTADGNRGEKESEFRVQPYMIILGILMTK